MSQGQQAHGHDTETCTAPMSILVVGLRSHRDNLRIPLSKPATASRAPGATKQHKGPQSEPLEIENSRWQKCPEETRCPQDQYTVHHGGTPATASLWSRCRERNRRVMACATSLRTGEIRDLCFCSAEFWGRTRGGSDVCWPTRHPPGVPGGGRTNHGRTAHTAIFKPRHAGAACDKPISPATRWRRC